MEKLIREFAGRLNSRLGTRLVSFIVYGSAVAGDKMKSSDINTMLVLEEADTATLDSLSAALSWWGSKKQPMPLIFTEKELISSQDTYPIEFFDIKETHQTVLGREIADKLKPSKKHLRLEAEREIKKSILRLRHAYCRTGGKPKEVRKLICSSVSTFIILLKSILRLYNIRVPARKTDILNVVPGKTGINPKIFADALSMKEGRFGLKDNETAAFFNSYLYEIERLSKVIDSFSAK